MKTACYFFIPHNPNIQDILDNHKIKYKYDEPDEIFREHRLRFTIFKEDRVWEELKDILPSPNNEYHEFSKKELDETEWLTMRSKIMKLDSKNEDNLEYSCLIEKKIDNFVQKGAYHQKQVAPFFFTPVKWTSNNHFYSSYTGGYNIIFCDNFAKNFIDKENFKGIKFDETIWHKKNIPLPDVYQINLTNILPEKSLVIGEHAKKVSCPMCGRIKYDNGPLFLLGVKEAYLKENIDFYKTPEIFGSGRESSLLIASNRVYRKFHEAGLDRNLVFEPVVLY